MSVSYASFFIEGGFIDLLRLTGEIEKNIAFARISSASFTLKEDAPRSPTRVVLQLQMSKIELIK